MAAQTSEMERLISILTAEAGYREGKGNHNKYSAALGFPPDAWCYDLLTWGAIRAGIPADRFPRSRSVIYATNWGKARGRFTRGTTGLRRGDMLICGGPGTHIELALSGVGSDGRIERVGGNTNANGSANGDGVYHDRYRRAPSVYGYVRPDYRGTLSPVGTHAASTAAKATSARLAEDGILGAGTARALQARLGVPADGAIGPQTARAWQTHEGTPADGVIGGQTGPRPAGITAAAWRLGTGGSTLIRTVQRNLGLPVTGQLTRPVVKAIQAAMNRDPGAFVRRPR